MVLINNINTYDLDFMFIKNKCPINNNQLGKDDEYKNIDISVRKYKLDIKSKIDKLLNSYLDDDCKDKTYNKKYKHNFHIFLMSIIEATERQEIKNLVSNDLSNVNNNTITNAYDMCYNLLSLDMNLMDDNKNSVKKIGNLNSFVKLTTSMQKTKILPKIVMNR
tara:strand:+ start:2710 stop:3201 length:492 start_codon:yes stop_codon:yes gene_type:complete